jgi:hypothetical protein
VVETVASAPGAIAEVAIAAADVVPSAVPPITNSVPPGAEPVVGVTEAATSAVTGPATDIAAPVVAAGPVDDVFFASLPSALESVMPVNETTQAVLGVTLETGPETAVLATTSLDTGPEIAILGSPRTSWFEEWVGELAPGIDTTSLNVAAVTGLAAAGAYAVGRGAWSPGASMVFTNVRLLPCVATAAIQHSTATATSALTNVGRGGGVRGGGAPSPSGRAPFRPPLQLPTLPAGPLGDGFRNGTGGSRDLDFYEGSDRLLALLGVALGAVYLAVVTIWVALTRARWNGGLRARD